ncbi:methyltransferase domain-containing protein [Streptomyces sp. SCUT-3]|nr:SAM-dependent methyltransferase [Streptomyces sp. DJ]QMV24191.1 methyltransferase domain-containing protein [Streptomyces sp. SCUT-3]
MAPSPAACAVHGTAGPAAVTHPRRDRRFLLPSARVTVHHAAGVGYQRAADVYERSRPSYPIAALAELADGLGLVPGARVADLGAGTGKFTRLLALTGARVVAVEPVERMRARLSEFLPRVAVTAGTAEDTGLPDGSADAVVAAQSWHWFREEQALAEVERILRPGGGLGLVWNTWDTSVPWVRAYQEVFFRLAPRDLPSPLDDRWRRAVEGRPGWSAMQERHLPNPHSTTRRDVVERMMSSSHIAVLDEERRARVRAEVEAVLDGDPQTRGRDRLEMPCTTDVYWLRRLG